MRARLGLSILAGAALASSLAPAAATPKEANVTGPWSFQTQSYGPNCRLAGAMMIRPVGAGFACTFTAEERCPDITVKARETCEARRVGDAITITARVQSVAPRIGYEPDNFELKIESSAYMRGMLRSFHSAAVEFFRGQTPVS